jgi:iron complex outermembrane receptor protein
VAWSPLDAVAFRGTWGRSIRAPTLADLNTTRNIVVPRPVPDNSTPHGVALALFEVGNNPDITVERARSWTAGFDIDATHWIPGLTFSATYFNINFRDRIQGPSFSLNVLNDPAFASFVTRNPTAAQTDAACSQGTFLNPGTSCAASGATAIIDVRNRNLASVRTSGIDLNTFYERRWAPGTLRIRLDGTYLVDFTQQAFADAPATQLLNTQNNPMNLRLRGMLTWQQVHWGTSLGINFQNHYRDIASEPSRNVRSFTTFDAQLRYAPPTFGSSLLENTSLELNAVNVFNSSPPFLNNATAGLGYDQENADPTGRLLSIQVRKNW